MTQPAETLINLAPEWQLLLACAGADLTVAERQCGLDEWNRFDLDWDKFTEIAGIHDIAPLIYHSLKRSRALDRLPAAAAQALLSSYYGNAGRNALLYAELGAVLSAFKANQIDVIALKGAALAGTAYPNRALRPMSDVDLLVKKERLVEVENILRSLGYVFNWDSGTKQWLEQHFYNVAFEKRSLKIEIHWHIGPQSRLAMNMEPLWQRAWPIEIAGEEGKMFSPADLIFHVCQHFWKHNMIGGLRPLCDVAASVRHFGEDIDWELLVATAMEWQIAQYLHIELLLAKQLLNAPVPQACIDRLAPRDFDPVVLTWVQDRILGFRQSSPISPDFMQLVGKGPSRAERWSVLRKLFSRETIAQRDALVANRLYLQYPRRVGNLLLHYGPILWQLAIGNQETRAAAQAEQNQLRLNRWLLSGNSL